MVYLSRLLLIIPILPKPQQDQFFKTLRTLTEDDCHLPCQETKKSSAAIEPPAQPVELVEKTRSVAIVKKDR